MVITHNKNILLVNRPGHSVVSQVLPHQPVNVVQNVKQIILFWAASRAKNNSTIQNSNHEKMLNSVKDRLKNPLQLSLHKLEIKINIKAFFKEKDILQL